MSQQVIFKTTLFGFDKKQVLNYIYEIGEQAKAGEEALNAKIDTLTADCQNLSRTLEELDGQFQVVSAKLNAERESTVRSTRAITELNEEIDRQKRLIAEKDREILIQTERCHQLLQRAEEAEQRLAYKDELSRQVGDIILEAKRTAEVIVSKAKEHALDTVAPEKSEELHQMQQQLQDIKGGLAALLEQTCGCLTGLEAMLGPQTPEEPAALTPPATGLGYSAVQPAPQIPQPERRVGGMFFRGRGPVHFNEN